MKNEVDTTKNNKLIAEFMQLRLTTDGIQPLYYDASNGLKALPKYHSDWNWLMEVVEKIESLEYNVEFSKNHCIIIAEIEKIDSKRITKYSEIKIKAVYNACIEFIKWYNRQQINQAIQDSIDVDEWSK